MQSQRKLFWKPGLHTQIDIQALLDSMAAQLKTQVLQAHQQPVLMIGIHSGGIWVADQLYQRLHLPDPIGKLNITFYRDDFSQIGLHPSVGASDLPYEIDDRHIVLVDDVLYTGRTIRAALNELFDYGRPASVKLAVLAQRNGRELPIQADIVGTHLQLNSNEYLQLNGPDPLLLSIQQR